jgi:hypothetical protein
MRNAGSWQALRGANWRLNQRLVAFLRPLLGELRASLLVGLVAVQGCLRILLVSGDKVVWAFSEDRQCSGKNSRYDPASRQDCNKRNVVAPPQQAASFFVIG